MRRILIIVIIMSAGSVFGQVSMGSISKESTNEKVNSAQAYDSLEKFTDFSTFYQVSPYNEIPESERPNKSDFYSRYEGLVVYYPMFPDFYRVDEIFAFKNKGETLIKLNWSDLGENYYVIQSIQPSFQKTELFEKVTNSEIEISRYLSSELLFELKDKKSGEIVYVVEPSYNSKFILTSYYTAINKVINQNIFVAPKFFNARKVPLSDQMVGVNKDTEWKGELTILRSKDLWSDFDENAPDSYDIKYMVILNHANDTILMYLSKDDHYESLQAMFITKSDLEQQKQKAKTQTTAERNKLKQQYGEKYGDLICKGQVGIGMSKEMCLKAWGPTLNRRTYTGESSEMEVWKYVGIGKLFFKDGKLFDIIRY